LYFRHSQISEQRIALPHPDLNPKKRISAASWCCYTKERYTEQKPRNTCRSSVWVFSWE
jgi:hypothetical protein